MRRAKLTDEADFVIIGTGAGGATAARVLSGAGFSVVMLEEGRKLETAERGRGLLASMGQSFRDLGTTTTAGRFPMPMLQGRCVGGSTAINSGIIWRTPEDVCAEWSERHGLGELVEARALERAFDTIEDELGVHETDAEVLGGNSGRMEEACRLLGLPGRVMHRNTKDCKGRGQCLQGCPGEARQSMDVSYVPRTIAAGGRLHAQCRAERIVVRGGRAVGVEGVVLDGERKRVGKFEMAARRGVVLAASVTCTPGLLMASGVRAGVGAGFMAHPGVAMVGRFPMPVAMSFGATQGYEVPLRARRLKLESLSLPPEMLAARLPGAGAEWQERLTDLDHYAQWAGVIRMRAVGRIARTLGGGTAVRYMPTGEDLATAREALALMAEMMLTAGATEVFPGVTGWPEVVRDMRGAQALETAPVAHGSFHFMASHLFGGALAGRDPATSVVGADLETHAVRDLFVMDSSVFPTNLGVNPQHSIMAIVWNAAEKLANRERTATARSSTAA